MHSPWWCRSSLDLLSLVLSRSQSNEKCDMAKGKLHLGWCSEAISGLPWGAWATCHMPASLGQHRASCQPDLPGKDGWGWIKMDCGSSAVMHIWEKEHCSYRQEPGLLWKNNYYPCSYSWLLKQVATNSQGDTGSWCWCGRQEQSPTAPHSRHSNTRKMLEKGRGWLQNCD